MSEHICSECKTRFEVLESDLKLYEEKGVAVPGLCPDCRHQRRLLFRNETFLYNRNCNKCKKSFISIYSPEKPYTVYCSECFWSDSWDPLSFGKPFDFNRPFFDQLSELLLRVPLLGNTVFNSTNCEYNAFCVDSKDCYMCTRLAAEDCMYSYLVVNCESSVDCFNIYNSQLLYECVDCWSCYGARFSQLCRNSSEISFCYDCIGCRNCFGCFGLRNAEYHFFNKKCTKEEYEKLVSEYDFSSSSGLSHIKEHILITLNEMPRRALYHMNSQNVHGDFIVESKDIYDSFDIEKSDTVRHCFGAEYSKDVVDGDFMYYAESCFNSISNSKSTNCDFCFAMLGGNYDCLYSMLLFNNSHDCFGSVSLKKGSYSILNVQYERDEYFALKAKIIEHMKNSALDVSREGKSVCGQAEWGHFFPPSLSCFGYNETAAQLIYPLTKEEAIKKGFKWFDGDQRKYDKSNYMVHDSIADVDDSILAAALSCSSCDKNFRIVSRELAFYKTHKLPIPPKCPHCRYKDRVNLRNPKKLFDAHCHGCEKNILTSYSPESSFKFYCEDCYSKFVY